MTYSDGVKNLDETSIDCGGASGIPCHNCLKEDSYGSAASSGYFNLEPYVDENTDLNDNAGSSGEDVYRVVKEAEQYYASAHGITVDEIDTADEKMEAVSLYLYEYMGYMMDDEIYGRHINVVQSAAYTVSDSMNRMGFESNISDIKKLCTEIYTKSGKLAKFCGDCEDHAILREAMLRYMGVSSDCAYVADYQNGISQPSGNFESQNSQSNDSGPGMDDYHDYYNATNLDNGPSSINFHIEDWIILILQMKFCKNMCIKYP